MSTFRFSTLLVLGLGCLSAAADFQLTSPDGQRVLLKDDFTWEYVAAAPVKDDAGIVLSVFRQTPQSTACVFHVQLKNNSNIMVRSLVPQVSAMTANGTPYETVYVGFAFVKPTRAQTKKITFSGITCDAINYLKLSGADRCNMGDLTPASAVSGECLAQIGVASKNAIRVSK